MAVYGGTPRRAEYTGEFLRAEIVQDQRDHATWYVTVYDRDEGDTHDSVAWSQTHYGKTDTGIREQMRRELDQRIRSRNYQPKRFTVRPSKFGG